MASFATSVDFDAVESADGTYVTFTQKTFDTVNDEGYVKEDFTTNQLVLKDYAGEVIDTLDFTESDTQLFYKTADLFIKATLEMDGGPTTVSKTEDYAFRRITVKKFQDYLIYGYGKQLQQIDNIMSFIIGYEYAAPLAGAEAEFQRCIEAANAYLDSAPTW